MTIHELELRFLKDIAPLDRELIFSHVLEKSREFVLAHPEHGLTTLQTKKISALMRRRAQGEPLAHLTGHKEFFGLDFEVSRHTLVPRPETELLVEKTLEELRNLLRNGLRSISVVDIGTGSGNIVVSIAKNVENPDSGIRFYGIDISKKALAVARRNAQNHRAGKKINFLQGDLLEPLMEKISMAHTPGSLIITANLPYLDSGWKNLLGNSDTRGLKFEPDSALYAGQDGLDAYRQLAEQLKELGKHTLIRIILFAEIGHRQKSGLAKIFKFSHKIGFFKDLAGHWRVARIEL